jgi:predicted transposase YdaD
MLGLCAVELKQTRFYQEVFAEGRTGGRIVFLNVR